MNIKNNEVIKVQCPTCLAEVIFSELSPFRPFCSKRCQLIDLGEWAEEKKTIPGSPIIDENELWQNELDFDEQRHD